MYAPVIVFAYNRPKHLEKTLKALADNELAIESDLYVFVDGPKKEEGKAKQDEVCSVITKFKKGYFSSVTANISNKNKGLASSIIGGVSQVIEQYGRAIILEDDSVTSSNYLKFMNQALNYYENDRHIWSIGGYVPEINFPTDYSKHIFMTQRSSSLAWATWKNRWEKIDWEVKDYNRFRFNLRERRRFNRWGVDRASMLDDQMNSRIDSWAIRFDYAMFKNEMFNIVPVRTMIVNIGSDGTGTHDMAGEFKNTFSAKKFDSFKMDVCLEKVSINEKIRKAFCIAYSWDAFSRLKRFVSNYLLYEKNKYTK